MSRNQKPSKNQGKLRVRIFQFKMKKKSQTLYVTIIATKSYDKTSLLCHRWRRMLMNQWIM